MNEHKHEQKREWTPARRQQLATICVAWALLTLGCVTATHSLEVVPQADGSTGGKILVEYEIHEPLHEYLQEQEGASNSDGTEVVEGWTVEQAEQGRIIRMSREFTSVQEFVATVPEMEHLLGGDEESEDLITQLEVVSSTLASGDLQYEMALTVLIPPEEGDEAVGESFFGTEDPELIAAIEESGDPRFLISMTMPGAIIEATDNDEASGDAVSDSVISWEFGPDDVGEHVLRAVSVVGPGALEEEDEEQEEQEEEEDETGNQADQQEDEAENALLELLGTPTSELVELTTVIDTVTPYATAQSLAKGDASAASVARAVDESDIKGVPPDLLSSIQGTKYLQNVTDEQGKPLFPALIAMDEVMNKMWVAALTDEEALTAVLRLQSILIRRDLGKLAAKQQAAPGATP